MVTTQNTQANGNTGFSQKFGRFMARLKSPTGKFCFPAFWLWRDYEEIMGIIYDGIQKGVEFDIWEILGHAPDICYHTLHSPGFDMRPSGSPLLGTRNGVEQWKTSHMQQFQRIQDTDFSADFHWVALDWFSDNSISWYVEVDSGSNQLFEVANSLANPAADDGVIDEAMLILNNAYGSDWSHNQSELYDKDYENFVGVTPSPWDLEISDVVVQQFEGEQTSGVIPDSQVTRRYTTQTVVGPEGTIDDVVVLLPTRQTDRQGTIHEIEARIAYRPANIRENQIGIEWEIIATPPLTPVFVDGNNKSWRARVHMTTVDTSPLPEALEFTVNITRVFLKT